MAFLFVPALCLLLLYTLLIGYYHKGFRQLKEYNDTSTKGTTKVTIIIPARNEEKNIANCLQAITAQTYPKHLLQVIVVDDFSDDATASIVQTFVQQNEHIQLLQLSNVIKDSLNSYKKKSIELAIDKANGELIVSTDADCMAGKNWIATIVSFYEKTNAQFIALPVCLTPKFYKGEKGSLPSQKPKWRFVEIFQCLDFLLLQGITAASVNKNVHTMCNGANVAYTKKAFKTVNGFKGIDNIASGDDMLLMYKIKQHYPNQIGYIKSEAAIVQSLTVPDWKAFFAQRIRWASKASHYNDKKMFWALVLVYFTNVVWLLLLISIAFAPQLWLWVMVFIGIKALVEFRFLLPILSFFKQQQLVKWFWICIPIHILYTIVAGFLGKFGSYKWKGRTVK